MASFLDVLKSPDPTSVEEPEVAFELFMPGAKIPKQFGDSFAYPCVPLIGVYTDESYDPALPIALLGVPLEDEATQVPPAIAKLLARARAVGFLDPGKTELYYIIHSGLQGNKPCCQRWCPNRDEFNVMTHAWAFADDRVADTHHAITTRIIMGLFDTRGVHPVHLVDCWAGEGGVPFDSVSEMRVVMHDRRFSPCNANVRLATPVPPVASFFSLAIDKEMRRAVVTYHVLPTGDPPADAIRAWMRGRASLGALAAGVDEHLSGDASRALRAMLSPMARKEAAAAAAAPPAADASAVGAPGLRAAVPGGSAASGVDVAGGAASSAPVAAPLGKPADPAPALDAAASPPPGPSKHATAPELGASAGAVGSVAPADATTQSLHPVSPAARTDAVDGMETD